MPFPEAVKRQAKEKAHYQCVLCRTPWFLDVHHVMPEAEGGPDSLENAAPLCPNCHTWFGHDPAKRTQVRTIRDWWWDRCAQVDAAQLTSAVGQGFDQLFQTYQESQMQERERLFADMKAFIGDQFREQAFRISSAGTITELVQASSTSTAYGGGAYGSGSHGETDAKCPSCGAPNYTGAVGCASCGTRPS